jgi:Zn-dependent protease
MLGRVTANPIKHIDPVGTILVPGMLLLLAKFGSPAFIFGWAKPVPVNFGNLRNPKRDMFWVAGAGPAANFAMAIAWGLLFKASMAGGALASNGLMGMAGAGIQVNLMLMALNLLPILPLDGGRIAVSLLPHSMAVGYARMEPYGFMIVIALLATGVLAWLMQPILHIGEIVLVAILGL